jgi:NAD(P)-dependent dehydrogenase (short-subunit alcohol dehydrogenase family)
MISNGTKKGSIILVASIASYMAIRSQMSSAYCGTKGAVRAMCPPIAAELNKYVGGSFCEIERALIRWDRASELTRFHLVTSGQR